MNKRIYILFCLFIISAICLPYVYAPAMAGVSPSRIELPFFPNAEHRIDFRTSGYESVEFEFKCPYVHPINETLNDEDGARTFSVILSLPEKINSDPGEYNCGFNMHRPSNPDMPAGVSASAEVGVLIYVHIPEKGRYAAISIEAQSANKGDPVFFHVSARNLGDEDLYGVSARIEVMDMENKTKATIWTESADVPRYGAAELWKRMETTDYEPARYNAKAVMVYGGEKPAYAETSFLIGKLFVKFLNFQTNATAGKINPVTMDVESWWGNPIENVRAEISMYNASGEFKGDFRTESVDLPPWQKATLKGYWDANGLEAGDYDANVTLRYKGGETSEIVKVILQKQPEEPETNKAFDKIKEVLVNPAFLAIIVLILIINVCVWALKQRKKTR